MDDGHDAIAAAAIAIKLDADDRWVLMALVADLAQEPRDIDDGQLSASAARLIRFKLVGFNRENLDPKLTRLGLAVLHMIVNMGPALN